MNFTRSKILLNIFVQAAGNGDEKGLMWDTVEGERGTGRTKRLYTEGAKYKGNNTDICLLRRKCISDRGEGRKNVKPYRMKSKRD
jgi:hypothetical protein